MENEVTIYKLKCVEALDSSLEGESCSLMPWVDTPDCRGCDDGGKGYVLPNGYAVNEDENGMPVIIGASSQKCKLMLHNGCPLIIDGEREFAILLEPVKKIMRKREQLGITRAKLAETIGVTQKELYEWENAEKQPDKKTISSIAGALGCKTADLI